MRVSVIVPTFNRRTLILQTLPTVLDQTFPANDYEVIIVVDGSTDGTAEALKHIVSPVRIRVLEQDNRGQAAANNAGLRVATGELVLFLDDDLFCERTLIAEHFAAHGGGDYLVFGPVLVEPRSPETLATRWMRSNTQDWLFRLERDGVRWPADATVIANSSMRRDSLIATGGFDEHFLRALDTELGLRLWKNGVRFKFCPMAVTRQFYAKSTDDLTLRDAPLYGVNEDLLCRKHPEFRRYSQLAGFTRGTWSKRKARELCVRFPLPMDWLLKLGERVVQANARMGIRVFHARQQFRVYRSAAAAAGGWRQFERDYATVLPVLMYHHVGPVQPGTYPALTVAPGRFEKQMGWLKRNSYTTICTGDWLAWCLEGKPLPPKPVMVTFDDAYADLVEYAFPVLRKYDFTATVFVVTGEIGGHNSWDQKNGSATLRCMGADKIKRWSGEGIEFGSHTRTHPDLTTLSEPEIEEEIVGSGRDLAKMLEKFPLSFAFPFGAYNNIVHKCVKKSYQLAFTSDEGLNGLATQPHALRRTMIQPGYSVLDFALRVKFGWDPIERLRARVRPRGWLRGTRRVHKGT